MLAYFSNSDRFWIQTKSQFHCLITRLCSICISSKYCIGVQFFLTAPFKNSQLWLKRLGFKHCILGPINERHSILEILTCPIDEVIIVFAQLTPHCLSTEQRSSSTTILFFLSWSNLCPVNLDLQACKQELGVDWANIFATSERPDIVLSL